MKRGLRVAVMVVAMGALFSAPARADTIALTGGVLDVSVPQGSGVVVLVGDRGFTFTALLNAFFLPPVGDPMLPGTSIALEGMSAGLDLIDGIATLDGVTYTDVGGLTSSSSAFLRFSTLPATLPSVLDPPSEITARLMVDLFFAGAGFQHTLLGSGMATIFLDEAVGFDPPSWRVTRILGELSSDTAPIPEPTTILLLSTGLAGIAARRRKRENAA
jgi:hypothetical protein